jgi:protein-export membrane protein SecD
MLRFSKWYATFVMVLCGLGVVLAILNFMPRSWTDAFPIKIPRYALGLDLQGGSHILLAIDSQFVRRERLENKRDDVRRLMNEQPRVGYTGLAIQGDTVVLRIREQSQMTIARERLRQMEQPLGSALAFGSTIRETEITEPEPGLLRLTLTEAGFNERVRAAIDQSIEIVRRRVDQLGTTEPSIARQGRDRILVQVPGLQDPQELKRLLGQTARMTFRLVDQSVSVEQAAAGRAPPDSELLDGQQQGTRYLVERRVMVAGDDLVDSQPSFDQRTNEPIVTFRFNVQGARRFAAVTQENVGRPFAIVLDNRVISAPVIREPILGGSGQISGQFTAPLIPLEERTVGPGLGADSIESGKLAAYIAVVLVAAFMVATYGFFGLLANIALVVHVAIIFSGMALVGATLTLPGIAGIVLTIGMAVDSNVLIYERIREELRLGKSVIAAIETGFNRALGTIWDANITSLIATVILFFVGTGPVRGFAVTFAIGILTTVFTAVTFVRLMVAIWVRWRRPTALAL